MGEAGVEVLSYFVSVDRLVSPGDEEARWGLLVRSYRELMTQAEHCGVKIALPTGGPMWRYEGLVRLMRDVPSPCNGVCFCTGYSWRPAGQAWL